VCLKTAVYLDYSIYFYTSSHFTTKNKPI